MRKTRLRLRIVPEPTTLYDNEQVKAVSVMGLEYMRMISACVTLTRL